jgi:tetratricopeptide (TPR) repeat protein
VAEHERTRHSRPDGSFGGESTAADRPAADAHETVAVGTRVGPYIIVDTIGAGAMGVVYAAFDPRLDRQIAIKMVRSNPGEASRGAPRLFREAQALAKLSHPNVVPVFDVGHHGDGVFLAMELVRGDDLRHWLDRERRPWSAIVPVMLDAARGLAAAHAVGIVHRDFKPDNVLLDATGRARVTDFGLARGQGELDAPPSLALDGTDSLSATLTRTGSVVGTPSYMAPEQHTGRPVDTRADQYAFCVTLYEAIYGERPFIGRDLQDLANHKWAEAYASDVAGAMRRAVPPGLHALMLRGLRRRPEQRFADMHALVAELERHGTRRTRRAPLVLGGLAAAAAMASGALFLLRDAPCPDARAQLAAVWDDARRDRIEAAFAGSETKVALDTWPRVHDGVEAWASAWTDAHGQICAAAQANGRVDPELDAGMLCLRQGRARLGGVLDVLEEGSREAVHSADTLLATLVDPHACHDATASNEPPAVTRERQRLRESLALADVRLDAAQYGIAREIVKGVAEDARRVGLVDVELEARLSASIADSRSGRYTAAEDGFTAVFWGAEAEGHDALALAAATRMVFLVGELMDRPDAGLTWLRHAESLLARLGEGQTLSRAKLLENASSVYDALLQEERGEALLREALAIRLRLQPDDDPSVSTVRNNLALRLADRGAFEEALALHRLARRNRVARLGPYHPDVAMSLVNEARPLTQLDRGTEALERLAEAEPIVRASLGDSHPMLDSIMIGRAAALMELDELDAARMYVQLALSTTILRTGPDSRGVGHLWNVLAVTYLHADDVPRARIFFERARETFTAAGPSGELGLAYVASNRAALELMAGELDEAKALVDSAITIFSDVRPPGHPDFALAFTNRAEIELARGELAAARRSLDEAAAIHVIGRPGELREAIIDSARARLQWLESGVPANAEAELLGFRRRIAEQDAHATEVAVIDRWIEQLRSGTPPKPTAERPPSRPQSLVPQAPARPPSQPQ